MKKLKLNVLSEGNLSKLEMNQVKGGSLWCCECGCKYASSGGSSTSDNCNANYGGGKSSVDTAIKMTKCDVL